MIALLLIHVFFLLFHSQKSKQNACQKKLLPVEQFFDSHRHHDVPSTVIRCRKPTIQKYSFTVYSIQNARPILQKSQKIFQDFPDIICDDFFAFYVGMDAIW